MILVPFWGQGVQQGLRVLLREQLEEEGPGLCGSEPAWIPFPLTNYMSGIKPWLKKFSFLSILESVNIVFTEHYLLLNSCKMGDDFWWKKLCRGGFFLIFFHLVAFFNQFYYLALPP
jgi:hypothetical protein